MSVQLVTALLLILCTIIGWLASQLADIRSKSRRILELEQKLSDLRFRLAESEALSRELILSQQQMRSRLRQNPQRGFGWLVRGGQS